MRLASDIGGRPGKARGLHGPYAGRWSARIDMPDVRELPYNPCPTSARSRRGKPREMRDARQNCRAVVKAR
jgi:hypothetical protein